MFGSVNAPNTVSMAVGRLGFYACKLIYYVRLELFDPSILEPRSDPIRSRHLKKKARSDPIRSKKCFDPVRSNEKILDPIRSDPTQASRKKSSIRSKYFKIIPIRSNYLYLINDLIKVLNSMFNQIQLEFYITLLQFNIISNYFRCIFLIYFCLNMIKIVFIMNLHQ